MSELQTGEQILDILADNPARMATLISDLTPTQLQTRPNPEEWSANDLLAHFRSCADVWGGCIDVMLAEDNPTIRIVSPRAWISSANYRELDFRISWDAFIEQRTNLILILKSLSSDDWMRPAIVKDGGRTLKRTVKFYAQVLARHERSHLEQLRQIVDTILV